MQAECHHLAYTLLHRAYILHLAFFFCNFKGCTSKSL